MPERRVGDSDLAGFIDGSQMNAKKKISRLNVSPIARPPNRRKLLIPTIKLNDSH